MMIAEKRHCHLTITHSRLIVAALKAKADETNLDRQCGVRAQQRCRRSCLRATSCGSPVRPSPLWCTHVLYKCVTMRNVCHCDLPESVTNDADLQRCLGIVGGCVLLNAISTPHFTLFGHISPIFRFPVRSACVRCDRNDLATRRTAVRVCCLRAAGRATAAAAAGTPLAASCTAYTTLVCGLRNAFYR